MRIADGAAALERIAGAHAPLKIVLKTRDEPLFLNDWIAHHGALVGAENLIVLDNGSTDPAVLATYRGLRDRTPILRVDGFYDDVHYPARFAEFYAALRAGCDAFQFLDTDEFLVHFDGAKVGSARGILTPVREGFPGDFIPTTRLNGVPLYRNRFFIGSDDVALRRQLKWSKPVIRSPADRWPEVINCNLHLRGALQPHPLPGYLVLHTNLLSPEHRIRNNVNKLVASEFMKLGEPLEAVVSREVPQGQWMVGIYVDEIRRLLPLQGAAAPDDAPLAPGTIKIESDGTLAFASAVEENVLRDYVDRFAEMVRTVIIEGKYPSA